MKKRKIVNYIIISITSIVILWLIVQSYIDFKIEKNNFKYEANKLDFADWVINNEKEQVNENKQQEYPKEEIIKTYRGYEVLAKLEIPIINLKTYILKSCTKESLNKSVAKFWGADANQIGNFCIAGHNAPRNDNMFYNLKKLEKGNILTISDNAVGKVEYEIYDIYNVLPEDVSCLLQETDGRREVTLITCTNDSKKRTIVKAREIFYN